MASSDLYIYIQSARTQGLSNEEISSKLVGAGWAKELVDQALSPNLPVSSVPSVPPAPLTQGQTMWDTFLHVLMFISLYVTASSFALILHQFVDRWFPGVSASGYRPADAFQSYVLNGALAGLIVSFPMYAILFLLVTRRTIAMPHIRHLSSRKTLTYMTLVGTFIIMMANVITTVFNLLSGNITLNFVLHFCVTVGISLIVFIYYLFQVNEDRRYG